MAHPSDVPDLSEAWRALLANEFGEGSGWRTIPVVTDEGWQLLGGVRFPAREEAILVGFRLASGDRTEDLPKGSGFQVERVTALEREGARAWFALTRASGASLGLFTAMVEDVARLLIQNRARPEQRLIHLFIGRIRAWQAFMSRPSGGVLAPEAELGLFGELVVLEHLLDTGVPAAVAVDSWQGPLDGLQDYTLGLGALEVKTTLAASGFPVRISSLEQLDEALVSPLFLAGVRASLQTMGQTLPDCVEALRRRAGTARPALDMRLLHGGYRDCDEAEYTRRFSVVEMRVVAVDERLIHLTRSSMPPAIQAVTYDLDLDLSPTPCLALADALDQLGLMTDDA
jgi:hypothetical protein